MVVEVLIAQCQCVDSLGDQVFNGVLDQTRIAMLGETSRELSDDSGGLLRFSQQEPSGVGGDLAAVETSHNFAGAQVVKFE